MKQGENTPKEKALRKSDHGPELREQWAVMMLQQGTHNGRSLGLATWVYLHHFLWVLCMFEYFHMKNTAGKNTQVDLCLSY